MAKKHKSKRNKVNWHNPKVKTVVNYLALGENRIEKSDILSLSNKDIFYQLKNSGYIRETTKDMYIGTPKLLRQIKNSNGTLFSSSSSMEHSRALRNSLFLLPKGVIEQQHFHTAPEIEKRFNRTIKDKPLYKEELSSMIHDCRNQLSNLHKAHSDFYSAPHSAIDSFNETVSYSKQCEELYQSLHILENKPYLIPDYQVSLTKEELSEYITNLDRYTRSLEGQSKQMEVYSDSIAKLTELYNQSGAQDTVTFNIEIITDSYGNRELTKHKNFEHFSGTPQIFLM